MALQYLRERSPVVPSPSVYHQRFMRYGHPKISPHPHGLHRTGAVRLPRRLPASYAKAPLGVRAYIAPCFDWKCHHPFFWHSTRDSNWGLSTWRSHLGLRLGSTSSSTRDVDGPRGCLACLQAPHLNNTFPSTLYAMLR